MSAPPQSSNTSQDDSLWAGISYASLILCCVPIGPLVIYFLKRYESNYIAFHASQATVFGLIYIALSILLNILSTVVTLVAGQILGPLAGILSMVVGLCMFGFFGLIWILLMVRTFRGQSGRMPLLSDLGDQLMTGLLSKF